MRDFQGSKFVASQNMDIKEIAVLLRREIFEAVKSNNLPTGKYSVTIDRYAGGQSINIRIKEFEFAVYEKSSQSNRTYTKVANLTLSALNKMLNAYNYDNSDPQRDYFDVRFYGHAQFDLL